MHLYFMGHKYKMNPTIIISMFTLAIPCLTTSNLP